MTIPDGIGGIGSKVFYHNENITDFYIPESVTYIDEDAFCFSYDNGQAVYSIKIHGKRGSAAEKYADSHNITFIEN